MPKKHGSPFIFTVLKKKLFIKIVYIYISAAKRLITSTVYDVYLFDIKYNYINVYTCKYFLNIY